MKCFHYSLPCLQFVQLTLNHKKRKKKYHDVMKKVFLKMLTIYSSHGESCAIITIFLLLFIFFQLLVVLIKKYNIYTLRFEQLLFWIPLQSYSEPITMLNWSPTTFVPWNHLLVSRTTKKIKFKWKIKLKWWIKSQWKMYEIEQKDFIFTLH